MHTKAYQNLDDLLGGCPDAARYFQSLPGYTQEMLRQRRVEIRSEDTLHRLAEDVLQGDD